MIITEEPNAVVRFLNDTIEDGTYPLSIAAFQHDAMGNPTSDREPGVHLSHIIHDLYARIEHSHNVPVGDELTEKNVKMASGIAFEYIMSWAITNAYPSGEIIVPPPFQIDGVWMTPDRLRTSDYRVVEMKATWFSAKKAATPEEFASFFYWWMWQAMSYCRGLGTNLAEFWVMFVNGYYKPPKPIPPRVFMIEFTDDELENNWAMIVNHGKEMGIL